MAGGAETIQEHLDSGLIDESLITLAPVLLGTGIRMFELPLTASASDQTRTNASCQ
ncbi:MULTISPECIES: dihydrofolate reductase family protein [unclassified Streptomyces]|uniref:dihydrofolate reductase family protein n=1 Tax=unclassified Streptomyces TaxID=2593676 RepID=UPI002E7A7270|nr:MULTISPECIES: dihydrofolate reductase family protein [unclassified Streptomyces]MEE1757637.1 dihydrofolate reductase family protein [Streptomyces sp. SP18BB07]MEE1830411.1 dihydrofolate reductase family protein [Streptomyces sp. SP17KL33]